MAADIATEELSHLEMIGQALCCRVEGNRFTFTAQWIDILGEPTAPTRGGW